MIFGWWTQLRRKRLKSQPLPERWREVIEASVVDYAQLTDEERRSIEDYVRVFLPEKNWEGCGGFELTEEVQVAIAANVALLVLGLGEEYFDHVQSILVYPDTYVAPHSLHAHDGLVVDEAGSARDGEAWYRGPVILSWEDVLADLRQPEYGSNLVVHEFAHQLDMLNGRHADGIPPMSSREQLERWTRTVNREYEQLVQACRRGRHTLLDCYGATDKAEFFSVSSEVFFTLPKELQAEHPDLYDVLREFYRQDPAVREV
jgi:Mlc titration factor MtfA (ptsG expression regulator)